MKKKLHRAPGKSIIFFFFTLLPFLFLLLSIHSSAQCVISSFPWTEGFEGLTTFGPGVVPPCWSTQDISGNNWKSDSTAVRNIGAHSGKNYLYASYSSDAWVFTPGMQLTGGDTYYFSYYYTETDAISGFTITTAVGTSQNASGMTTTLGVLTNPTNTSYRLALYAYTPSSSGTYYFGIQSSAVEAPWYFNIDDVSLTTSSPCVNTIYPWTEGFESVAPGTGNVPPCWTTQYLSGPQPDWRCADAPVRNGIGAHTGTHYLYSSYNSDTWLFTPGMELTGGSTYYFSYYYALTDAIDGFTITTSVGAAQNDSSMTITLGVMTSPVNTNYEQAIYPFTPPTTGVYYFGVQSSATDPPYYFNVDDFEIQTAACQPPVPATANIVDSVSAIANWTCAGCTGSYVVEYGVADSFTTPGLTDTAGPGGHIVNVSAGNFSTLLSSLETGAQYRYFVRQNCGGGVYSVNYGSQLFSTAYCTSLYTTGCADADYINSFTLSNLSQLNSGCSGTSNTPDAGYGNFTTSEPVINLVAGETYTWTATYGYPSGEYLKIWIDLNNNGVLDDPGELIYDGTALGSDLASGTFTLSSYAPPGNHRLRVRDVYNDTAFGPCGVYGNGEGEAQDYTCNITIPGCVIPTSTAATNIDITAAQANWTCSGGCTGSYIVEYGPAATFTTPGTGATAGPNGTVIDVPTGNVSKVIAGLASGTQYIYYVRQNCGGGNGYSLNSAGQAFTTLGTINVNQQTGPVPPGTLGVNILGLSIPVIGNTLPFVLNSIKFTSKNTNDADVVAAGVKLWTGTASGPTTQIGTAQTFSSGAATFSGLNLNLITGATYYLWLTYDIASTATLQDTLDAKINAGDINFTANGTGVTLPSSPLDPAGNLYVYYCAAYLYTTGCADGDYINSFTLSNLSQLNSGCSGTSNTQNAGYGDFSATEPVINLKQGVTYTWTATYGYPSGEYLKIWIDLNNNGILSDSGELIYDGASKGYDLDSGTFTISPAAAPGNHRLRVRICYNDTAFGPCGQYGNGEGEVQDYTCNISVPACTVPTSSAATNVDLTSAQANWTCSGGCTGSYIVEYGPTATFTTPGAGAGAGANGTVINVSTGNVSTVISGLVSGTQYIYYVRQNCGGASGYSLNSAGQTFTTLGTINVTQLTGPVPPGSTEVSVLGLSIPVTGNTVPFILDSMKFTSKNTNDADVIAAGVKLWTGTASGPTTQIGTSQTFISGAVTFTGLNLNLITGATYYLWLTYDISATAVLKDTLDAKINAGDIAFTANGTGVTLPSSALDPAGYLYVYYCSSYLYTTGCNDDDEIISFSVSNLNEVATHCNGDTSNQANTGYGNFTITQPVINLVQAASYNWTMSINYPSNHWAQMWIDYNDDGIFETDEQLLSVPFAQPANTAAPDTFGSTFTIPSNAATGNHQFRVRIVYQQSTFDACTQYTYGEVEDYTCNITAAAPTCPVPASLAASNINFTSVQANWVCSGCTGILIIEYGPAGFTPGTGAAPGVNGTIDSVSSDSTSLVITGLAPGTEYTYYVRQDCSDSGKGFSINSGSETFTTLSSTSVDNIVEGGSESVLVYPNPAQNNFYIEIERTDKEQAVIKVELLDVLGQVLQTDVSNISGRHLVEPMNVPAGIATGIYFIRTTVNGNVYNNRLMISND